MSNDTVISVENLSKSYLIGHDGPQERYHSLRETLVRHGKNYVRKAIDMARGRQIIQGDSIEEFWALKDVSFEVKRGEVLGIIGRNGAGKSTLLKILSRITEPTSGRVTLNGRVASLLEVGTGFHPELTGRENIFLNGAILGMSKVEIRKKFDEIVDFAGVEKFLDTPVKRYSSGMYVRLAFAVAAHLEPEILIIDEVLAVGDAEFQKKCLGKMQDVAKDGRTVLFVSHNMNAINTLCGRALLLENGKVSLSGLIENVVTAYLNRNSEPHVLAETLVSCTIVRAEDGNVCQAFNAGENVSLNFRIHKIIETRKNLAFTIYNSLGVGIVSAIFEDCGELISPDAKQVKFPLPSIMFNPGQYRVEGVMLDEHGQTLDRQECYLMFSVYRSNKFDLAGFRSSGAMRLDATEFDQNNLI